MTASLLVMALAALVFVILAIFVAIDATSVLVALLVVDAVICGAAGMWFCTSRSRHAVAPMDKECPVCLEEKSDMVSAPCGLHAVCSQCTAQLHASGYVQCPLCRAGPETT